MTEGYQPDPPTAADRRRLRSARTIARQRVEMIVEAKQRAMRAAYHAELGATIRSVSPFLVALFAAQGISLDHAVTLIEPPPGWPRRPRLSMGGAADIKQVRHYYRWFTRTMWGGRRPPPSRDGTHGHSFDLGECDWARIEVFGHSLEVRAQIGGARFDTRFGVLRIELPGALPETLAMACIGRRVSEIVDHASLREQDWMIGGIEEALPPFRGQTLVLAIETLAYSMPWADLTPST